MNAVRELPVPARMRSARGALVGALLCMAACTPEPPMLSLTGEAMGTSWTVHVADANRLPGLDAQTLVDTALHEVDAVMSTWNDDSALMRFNAADSTDWISVPASLATVVADARRISELTGGAFDITAAPLVDAWGFGPAGAPAMPPTPAALAALRSRVGFRLLENRAEPPALRKHDPAMRADLSAIAKGYAVDRVALALEAAGSRNYLVEIGGELRIRGRRTTGEAWRIGIEQPDPARRSVQRELALNRDAALATSGDYRNFVELGGRRQAHIIDPRTGWPAAHALASVTVIAANCAEADALATALTVLGPQDGYRLARDESIAALFIMRTADGFEERSTAAFEAWLNDQETEASH
jgi:thiamine biosynthesis lipoprotein